MSEPRSARPTGETVGGATPRQVRATIAGVLLLVALANAAAVILLDHRPVNLGYRIIKEKWRLLLAQREPADWLVLGDSSGNQAVVPEVLGQTLGGRALNLCTIGALGAWNDAWMLDTHIDRVGPPRHVVLVHVYQVWEGEKNVEGLAQVPLPFGYWRGADPPMPLDAAETGRLFLDRYLPLYSQDRALATLVQYPWRVFGRPFEIGPQGFMAVTKPTPEVVLKDAESHREYLAKREFSLSAPNRAALERIGARAESHGFDVYVALGPVFEGLAADRAYRTRLAAVTQALTEVASRYTRLHVLGGEPMAFPAEQMQNADHLVETAARRYTERLARAITAAP